MGSLVLATTSPDYTPTCTLAQPGAVRAFLQVYNALVYYELDQSADGAGAWGDELPLGTVIASLGRNCSGIRFRSAKSNAAAIVCAELLTDPSLAGGGDSVSPNTITISPDGSISPGSGVFGLSSLDVFPSFETADRQEAIILDGRQGMNAVADPTLINIWNAFGIAYGGVSESNFGLPDLRGRTIFGVNLANGDLNAVGKTDGLAAASRTPKHNHTDTLDFLLNLYQTGGSSVGPGAGASDGATFVSTIDLGAGAYGAKNGSVGPGGARPTDAVPYFALNWFIVK